MSYIDEEAGGQGGVITSSPKRSPFSSPKPYPTQVPDEEAEVKEGEEPPTKSVPKTTQVLPTPTLTHLVGAEDHACACRVPAVYFASEPYLGP